MKMQPSFEPNAKEIVMKIFQLWLSVFPSHIVHTHTHICDTAAHPKDGAAQACMDNWEENRFDLVLSFYLNKQ